MRSLLYPAVLTLACRWHSSASSTEKKKFLRIVMAATDRQLTMMGIINIKWKTCRSHWLQLLNSIQSFYLGDTAVDFIGTLRSTSFLGLLDRERVRRRAQQSEECLI